MPLHAQSGRDGSAAEARYSRGQLLLLFRAQQSSVENNQGLSDLYAGAWEPNVTNGTSSAHWGRRDDQGREAQSGVDLCWDIHGSIVPLSLSEMAEDEREVSVVISPE